MKLFTLIYISLFSAVALAASGGHGDAHEVPTKLIGYQTFNVVVMIGALIYFLREPVKNHFAEKRNAYLSAAKKAEAARKAAEQERADIQTRLQKLESTAEESVARAKAEAADLKNQMIAEAQALSKRIRDEAAEAARHEVQRAQTQLREELIKESLQMARTQLSQKITADDHKRLQSDFIHNIQAVQ